MTLNVKDYLKILRVELGKVQPPNSHQQALSCPLYRRCNRWRCGLARRMSLSQPGSSAILIKPRARMLRTQSYHVGHSRKRQGLLGVHLLFQCLYHRHSDGCVASDNSRARTTRSSRAGASADLAGCFGAGEFLCIEEKFCLAANKEAFPVGMISEEGMICKIGLPCCTCGVKTPQVLCLSDGKCCCFHSAAAFPFKEGVVDGPVCAVYCLQCLPNCGCCKPPVKVGATSSAVQRD